MVDLPEPDGPTTADQFAVPDPQVTSRSAATPPAYDLATSPSSTITAASTV